MTAYTALHIVKLLWSWLFQKGSHYRHLSANVWSPVTDSFKWGGVHCQICQFFLSTMSIHLPAIYMHCPRSSSGCRCMPGLYAQLTEEDLCLIAFCYANIFGVVVFKASILDYQGVVVHLPARYIHCPRCSSWCRGIHGMYGQLAGKDIYMSQAQKRVWKRDKIPNFHNKWLFGVDAGGCTDKPWQFFCTCSVVFPPKWWSRWLWHH